MYGPVDFRSRECLDLLDEADIVVTTPPFSLFREYVAMLMGHKKKSVIVGNMNAITYKEVLPLLRDNRIWTGFKSFGGGMNMIQPKESFDPTKTKSYEVDEKGNIVKNVMGVIWYTNLDIAKRHDDLILYRRYVLSAFRQLRRHRGVEGQGHPRRLLRSDGRADHVPGFLQPRPV